MAELFQCRSMSKTLRIVLDGGIMVGGGRAQAGQDAKPGLIGTLWQVHSDILKEDRPLSIRIPASYAQNRLSYPVIYLP